MFWVFCAVTFIFKTFQEHAELLIVRYGSRWGNQALRGMLDVTNLDPARHLERYNCACQFIEYHFKEKPMGKCNFFICI